MSERIIWPLARSYWGKIWTLTAWCELRQSFRNFRAAISGPQFPGRNFRADRISGLRTLNSRYPDEPGKRLEDYLSGQRDWERETSTASVTS